MSGFSPENAKPLGQARLTDHGSAGPGCSLSQLATRETREERAVCGGRAIRNANRRRAGPRSDAQDDRPLAPLALPAAKE